MQGEVLHPLNAYCVWTDSLNEGKRGSALLFWRENRESVGNFYDVLTNN